MELHVAPSRRFGFTIDVHPRGGRYGIYFGTPMVFDLTYSRLYGWRMHH